MPSRFSGARRVPPHHAPRTPPTMSQHVMASDTFRTWRSWRWSIAPWPPRPPVRLPPPQPSRSEKPDQRRHNQKSAANAQKARQPAQRENAGPYDGGMNGRMGGRQGVAGKGISFQRQSGDHQHQQGERQGYVVSVRDFSHLRAGQRPHDGEQRNDKPGLPPDVAFGGVRGQVDQRVNGHRHGAGPYNQMRIRHFHHIQQ